MTSSLNKSSGTYLRAGFLEDRIQWWRKQQLFSFFGFWFFSCNDLLVKWRLNKIRVKSFLTKIVSFQAEGLDRLDG